MKIWAKIRFKGEKNAEHLIRAFFKEFNPESSIVIRGREAKVQIVFDKRPPMEMVEAITHCEVVEFYFGKPLGDYEEEEPDQVVEGEEIPQGTDQVVETDEIPQGTDQVVESEEIPQGTDQEVDGKKVAQGVDQVVGEEEISQKVEKPKRKIGRPARKEFINIPYLEETAKKATSFEHFAKLVAEWLEMDKRQVLFENLVIVAAEADRVSWKELEEALKNREVLYNQWDRIWCTRQVSEKLKDYSVTILALLSTMAQYKNYSFGNEQSEEENSTEQAIVGTITEEPPVQVKEVVSKNRVKMECMPEIPSFEEVLGSVDKTQPIEDRVKYVLTAMGWNKKNAQEQHEIFEIANTAVRLGRMSFDIIFLKANIPMESSMKARMTFSKFINDFVKEYGSDKRVKLLDFLKEMQEIVMYESEIESFADFGD